MQYNQARPSQGNVVYKKTGYSTLNDFQPPTLLNELRCAQVNTYSCTELIQGQLNSRCIWEKCSNLIKSFSDLFNYFYFCHSGFQFEIRADPFKLGNGFSAK